MKLDSYEQAIEIAVKREQQIEHAFDMGYIARKQSGRWPQHHYRGVEADAFERGVMKAALEAREALRVHGVVVGQ